MTPFIRQYQRRRFQFDDNSHINDQAQYKQFTSDLMD